MNLILAIAVEVEVDNLDFLKQVFGLFQESFKKIIENAVNL